VNAATHDLTPEQLAAVGDVTMQAGSLDYMVASLRSALVASPDTKHPVDLADGFAAEPVSVNIKRVRKLAGPESLYPELADAVTKWLAEVEELIKLRHTIVHSYAFKIARADGTLEHVRRNARMQDLSAVDAAELTSLAHQMLVVHQEGIHLRTRAAAEIGRRRTLAEREAAAPA
jgi:hypothetical protein